MQAYPPQFDTLRIKDPLSNTLTSTVDTAENYLGEVIYEKLIEKAKTTLNENKSLIKFVGFVGLASLGALSYYAYHKISNNKGSELAKRCDHLEKKVKTLQKQIEKLQAPSPSHPD